MTDPSPIEAAIANPHTIVWDNNAGGLNQDGGTDMYDGGNIISTSACAAGHMPYSDNMNEVTSNCFGPGGSYKMDIRNSMMVLLSHNTGTSSCSCRRGRSSCCSLRSCCRCTA
jgi:hypothetical protein